MALWSNQLEDCSQPRNKRFSGFSVISDTSTAFFRMNSGRFVPWRARKPYCVYLGLLSCEEARSLLEHSCKDFAGSLQKPNRPVVCGVGIQTITIACRDNDSIFPIRLYGTLTSDVVVEVEEYLCVGVVQQHKRLNGRVWGPGALSGSSRAGRTSSKVQSLALLCFRCCGTVGNPPH